MGVYDKNGNSLLSVYANNGDELLNAYDKNGTVIYTKYAPEPTGDVAIHGKLRKVGKYLVDKDGRQMEIRGVGTHHLLQYTNLHTYDAINSLKSYGVNCLRICAYLEDWDFASSDGETAYGYVSHPTETKAEIEKLINICVSLGMYILLDWHVLGNGTNGQSAPTGAAAFHQTEAEEFFTYFSSKYANLPNMMYELANEPYKSTYAQCVSFVTAIRNIITANVDDPIMIMNGPSANGASTMYDNLRNAGITDVFVSNHQYGQNQVTNYTNQWNNNYPLFNTEWGNSSSSGDGAGSDANAIAMLEWHHTYGVPHAVWKYTDQTMSTSLLNNLGSINSAEYADGFGDDDLSHNGTLFLKRFQSYATTDYIQRYAPTDVYQANKFSVIGDSYSTYDGYTNIEADYITYYPDRGNLTDVNQTWWKLFETQKGISLLANDSYSGSCICYDGIDDWSSDRKETASFVSRWQKIGYPQYIFVFGGTNDSWLSANLGDYKYSDWTESDKASFRPALAYVLSNLTTSYPLSTVIFIKNTGLKTAYSESIDTICAHYDVSVISLSNISKTDGHPTIEGMSQIATQVISAIN